MMRFRLLTMLLGLATLAASQPAPAPPQPQPSSHPLTPPADRAQRTLAEFNHRAWRLADNCPPDIWALAQSPDGFLWIGSGAGLYRFDGMVFEEVVPRSGAFPARNITALLAAPDGAIWIGYFSGEISRLYRGRLESWGTPGGPVEQIAQTADGTVWAARSGVGGGLFRLDGQRIERIGPAQGLGDHGAMSVAATRSGDLWVATERRILMRRHGSARFVPMGETRSRTRLAEAPDGTVWASGDARADAPDAGLRIVSMADGTTSADADRMIFARDGSLWFSSFRGGVVVMQGLAKPGSATHTERLTAPDGLTSPRAVPIIEDREGNFWIGTNLGLNRLRPVSAIVAIREPGGPLGSFDLAATRDGTVYIAESHMLYRAVSGGDVRPFHRFDSRVRMIEADGDGLRVVLDDELYAVDGGGRIAAAPEPPASDVIMSWSRDASGSVWGSIGDVGVFRLHRGAWRRVPLPDSGPEPGIVRTPSGPGGGDWLYAGTTLYRRSGGSFVRVPTGAAPRVGHIALVSTGPSGVLVGGETGLAVQDGSRFRTLDRTAAELSGITGIVQSDDGTIWINGVRGLIRTTRADLTAAIARPGSRLRHRLFDAGDGLPGVAQQDEHKSSAVAGGDGRIWVANNGGVGWIDPARVAFNRVPPPVVIRTASANGRTIDDPADLALPAGTRNLRITYTALSLAASQRVRFRYRLIGVDQDWVDAGDRREAFYANLPPGDWRFQVIASNNDGVWNREGTSIGVSIPPMFYQSWWFRLLCAGAIILLLWLFYVWRVREHMARTRARTEAQLGERARIARELHDTLLQGVQGLMLRFQAVANRVRHDPKVHAMLEGALERADDLILEARDHVQGLRTTSAQATLTQLIERAAERYRTEGLEVTITTHGSEPQDLPPALEKPLVAVVEEALANVLKHAGTRSATLTLTYGPRDITARIQDDGMGIPVEIVASGERPGHYGLIGMRERVEDAHGKFRLSSAEGVGTVIEASVPRKPQRRKLWQVWKRRG